MAVIGDKPACKVKAPASAAADRGAMADIEQQLGLTERMDSGAFLLIHSDELGHEFPRRMLNLVALVDDAAQRAVSTDWADASGLRIAPQWHGYGRYFRLNGLVVRFGIHFRRWALQDQTPLYVEIQERHLHQPIYLPTGIEYSQVLDNVVEQLEMLGEIPNLEQDHQ